MAQLASFLLPKQPWNHLRIIGPKPPFKPKYVWAIRQQLKNTPRISPSTCETVFCGGTPPPWASSAMIFTPLISPWPRQKGFKTNQLGAVVSGPRSGGQRQPGGIGA